MLAKNIKNKFKKKEEKSREAKIYIHVISSIQIMHIGYTCVPVNLHSNQVNNSKKNIYFCCTDKASH